MTIGREEIGIAGGFVLGVAVCGVITQDIIMLTVAAVGGAVCTIMSMWRGRDDRRDD